MKRSLKGIYFLVRYSHFQDDLQIYSELAVHVYNSRTCSRKVCGVLAEPLKDDTRPVETDWSLMGAAVHCGAIFHG